MKEMRIPALERALEEVLRLSDRPEIVEFTIMQLYKVIMKQQEIIEEMIEEKKSTGAKIRIVKNG